MRWLLIILSVVVAGSVYCSKYEDLKSRHADLAKQLAELQKAPIEISRWDRIKYPFGIPNKVKEQLLEKARKKREREIDKLKAEIGKIGEDLRRIKNMPKRVTKIAIKRIGPKDNKDNLLSWYWHDEKPDIYLKVNGMKICDPQDNCDNFELVRKNFRREIKFRINQPVTIEVWDSDVSADNRLFNIIFSGDADSPQHGTNGNFEWSVWWERVEK